MALELELKHLGLIRLKHSYMFYFGTTCLLILELCREHWPENHNKDDPIPCHLNVIPEHVSTRVSVYSIDHIRICLQLAKTIASSLFGFPQ